jgi:hypothetical protein
METFRWHTTEYHPTNETTMQDYLENHLPQCFDVIFEDGTYAEIKNKNTGQIWGVNASGDGDSFNHKVEFEFVH